MERTKHLITRPSKMTGVLVLVIAYGAALVAAANYYYVHEDIWIYATVISTVLVGMLLGRWQALFMPLILIPALIIESSLFELSPLQQEASVAALFGVLTWGEVYLAICAGIVAAKCSQSASGTLEQTRTFERINKPSTELSRHGYRATRAIQCDRYRGARTGTTDDKTQMPQFPKLRLRIAMVLVLSGLLTVALLTVISSVSNPSDDHAETIFLVANACWIGAIVSYMSSRIRRVR